METERIENAAKRIGEYDRLCLASVVDLDSISRSLHDLIECRKHVAREILRNNDDENKKTLTDLYFYINSKIKALLAIE